MSSEDHGGYLSYHGRIEQRSAILDVPNNLAWYLLYMENRFYEVLQIETNIIRHSAFVWLHVYSLLKWN